MNNQEFVNLSLSNELVHKILNFYQEYQDKQPEDFYSSYKEIGHGQFSEVYLFEEKYAIKIYVDYNLLDGEVCETNDPLILQELQHLDIYPTLYGYLPGKFMVVEYIPGNEMDYQDVFPQKFQQKLLEGIIQTEELGYAPYDLHGMNIKITPECKPKIIDVGAFKKGLTTEIPSFFNENHLKDDILKNKYLKYKEGQSKAIS